MGTIGRLTRTHFEQSVLHGVTLVDFDAPWCRPCRTQKPVIAELKKNYRGRAAVRRINIDENQDIAMHLGIQSIPTIILYKDGREMDRFIGVQNAGTLIRALKKLIDLPNRLK
ncbi:MAG: thioredoxin [Desulfosarcina sp.]|nr:thioredoxin [Desulfosarcina sp.]